MPKDAAQACDRPWGWGPHGAFTDDRPEPRFSGLRSGFRIERPTRLRRTSMNSPGWTTEYNRQMGLRNRRLGWAGVLVLAAAAVVRAQQGGGVDPAALMRDVEVLAADNMEGRLAGSPGGARARAYIERRMKAVGIEPVGRSYQAPFTFRSGQTGPERKGVNLVGVIRGAKSPNEYLVLTAHYDHIGVRN